MLVFWALAVILLAFAGFAVIVVRLRRRVAAADERSEEGTRQRRWRAVRLTRGLGLIGL